MLERVTSSVTEACRPERADKRRIAVNFSRAASTYDDAAALQDRVAARAMLGLPSNHKPEFVLDLGSGTGRQTIQVAGHYPQASVVGLDLAMGMAAHARSCFPNLDWCSGDIEHLPFKDNRFDVVFSSLAIQWCSLNRVLKEVHRVLKPGGLFVFSTLAAGTMHELRRAWSQVDPHVHVNSFDTYSAQKHCVQQSDCQLHSFRLQTETIYYPSVMQLLRDMKALGVNTVPARQNGLMSRHRILKLQEAYEIFRTEKGLPLSYEVIYGIVHRPLIT
ncbi:malonyl-ACP O-methyltransferase BioC [Endozoicomonas gorgoniicola]|uniref:Malonyl-[acyl-carrier protein] O-methyltransferase n=1 Tax=Endozoicomonas gorgoniicola TaxID=1234144 RepID=A0ABT3N0L0_9GAMM|nr:malonyl-ACP O-methyltransferase BioC [Endozoicomonas gorgoniicola]MCW7555161.1 malonyl-ACP O-methyltransferase BioC [Endozoicomonas gorgoniicola]